MKKKNKLKNFKNVKETSTGQLVGGFSVTISGSSAASAYGTNYGCETVNNCRGGNCTKGCGATK